MLAVTPSESRKVALIANPKFEVGLGPGHRARRLIDRGDPAFSDPFLLMAEDGIAKLTDAEICAANQMATASHHAA
jgi:hypothetical protein